VGGPSGFDLTDQARIRKGRLRPPLSPGIHVGCIQAGGGAECSDRSLLDFFQLVVFNGKANIIYTAGDQFHGTQLYFVKQT
jgi:hypothetical protein